MLTSVNVSEFPFVTGSDDQLHCGNLRNSPWRWERIDILLCLLLPAGNVDQNIAVEQVRHGDQADASTSQVAPEVVHVLNAVGHVLTIFPHSVKCKVL